MEVSSKESKSNKMSLEEFWEFCDNSDDKWELVNGIPIKMSRPGSVHTDISLLISRILSMYFEDKPCVSRQKYPIKLDSSRNTIRIPDFIVNCDINKQRRNLIIGSPDITIEIWSKDYSVRNLIDKNKEYSDANVREIWNIMLDSCEVIIYHLKGDDYKVIHYRFDQLIESPSFKGLIFDFSRFIDADDFTGYNV